MREWERIRHDYAQKPIQLGLQRVVQVWERLGCKRPPFVFAVGGTNGKGSCCCMLDSILRSAGYRVGSYTSPHLITFQERIRINGEMAGEDALDAAFRRVAACRGADVLTQFELDTLVAVSLMDEAGVDVAVLEVGLGGRLDAVNVFDADCAVLTSVDFDHMDYLGTTREQIGYEKAGIFRGGRPAICGEPEVPDSVARHAADIGAEFHRVGLEFGYATVNANAWRFWCLGAVEAMLPFPALRGAFQLNNAAVCLAALEQAKARLPVALEHIRQGLLNAQVPGRFQVLPGRPQVILDVAHNPHAARRLAENLRETAHTAHTLAVFAMLADKDIAGVVRAVADQVDAWFLADIQQPRGARASALATIVNEIIPGRSVQAFVDVASAFERARASAAENDRIVVFGSFCTVADVLRTLAP